MTAAVEGREVIDVPLHRTAVSDLEVEVWEFRAAIEAVGSEEEELASRPSKLRQQ